MLIGIEVPNIPTAYRVGEVAPGASGARAPGASGTWVVGSLGCGTGCTSCGIVVLGGEGAPIADPRGHDSRCAARVSAVRVHPAGSPGPLGGGGRHAREPVPGRVGVGGDRRWSYG